MFTFQLVEQDRFSQPTCVQYKACEFYDVDQSIVIKYTLLTALCMVKQSLNNWY